MQSASVLLWLLVVCISHGLQYSAQPDRALFLASDVVSAGNYTKAQAVSACDDLPQCDGFFGTSPTTPHDMQWFVFVRKPWELTAFPGIDSFLKQYPVWSCQLPANTCAISSNSSNITAAASASSMVACTSACSMSLRWSCHNNACRETNTTATPGTFSSLEECRSRATYCTNEHRIVWSQLYRHPTISSLLVGILAFLLSPIWFSPFANNSVFSDFFFDEFEADCEADDFISPWIGGVAGLAFFGELVASCLAACFVVAIIPLLLDAQTPETSPPQDIGLKVGLGIAATIFLFLRFWQTRYLGEYPLVGQIYLSSIVGTPCLFGLLYKGLSAHSLGCVAAIMIFLPLFLWIFFMYKIGLLVEEQGGVNFYVCWIYSLDVVGFASGVFSVWIWIPSLLKTQTQDRVAEQVYGIIPRVWLMVAGIGASFLCRWCCNSKAERIRGSEVGPRFIRRASDVVAVPCVFGLLYDDLGLQSLGMLAAVMALAPPFAAALFASSWNPFDERSGMYLSVNEIDATNGNADFVIRTRCMVFAYLSAISTYWIALEVDIFLSKPDLFHTNFPDKTGRYWHNNRNHIILLR